MTTPPTMEDTIQDILNRVKNHTRLKGVQVFEDGVTGGITTVTNDDGYLIPYLVFTFGGRGPVSLGQRGIVSTVLDLKQFMFGIEIYAATPGEVRRVRDDVVFVLEGYEPVGSSELNVAMSGQVRNPLEVQQNHSRDGFGLLLTSNVNTSTVG